MFRRSWKKNYPFRLCCPSFIYPAGYVENVRKLADHVDEIELLLLESAPGSLPTQAEISELKQLATEKKITHNIHLPTDVSPGAGNAAERSRAVDALIRAIDRSAVLSPTSYTLHLPYTGSDFTRPADPDWLDHIETSAEKLLSQTGLPPETVALETLDYPPSFLDRILERFDFGLCLDTGHLMVHGHDCRAVFDRYKHRLPIIHTHGVDKGQDHLALDRLNPEQTAAIRSMLSEFRGTVSLEVFSLEKLTVSLDYLHKIWNTDKK